MDTFYLFSKYLDETGCFCLKLDTTGSLIDPPKLRCFSEIKSLQKNCSTFIIEASDSASLLRLDLSWLPERKARTAIPYALEDKLAQPVEELHFAFDKSRYQNNHYLITVITKQRIHFLMDFFSKQDIEFNGITLDWFALEPQELCITETTLLINTENFKGALSGEPAKNYLKKHPEHHALCFKDSQIAIDSSLPRSEETSYTWIAQRIHKKKFMNLCQGEMQLGNKLDLIKKRYQLAGVLFCFWLLSILAVNAIHLHLLNNQIKKIDDQISVIYHDFFPNAKQVISPKFRITQLLKDNASEEESRVWFLLSQFAKVKNDEVRLQQVRYQRKTLFLTVISSDFAHLEKLENELKKLPLKVKQTQASTQEQQVVATLELT